MLAYHQNSREVDYYDKSQWSYMNKTILSSVSIDQSRRFIDYMIKLATEKARQSKDKMYQVKCLMTLLSSFFESKDDSMWTQVNKTNNRTHFQR